MFKTQACSSNTLYYFLNLNFLVFKYLYRHLQTDKLINAAYHNLYTYCIIIQILFNHQINYLFNNMPSNDVHLHKPYLN